MLRCVLTHGLKVVLGATALLFSTSLPGSPARQIISTPLIPMRRLPVYRRPTVHLMLEFNGHATPAIGNIWDFTLSDPAVLQCIREATASGKDVVLTAVTAAPGNLAASPYFTCRQIDPAELAGHEVYMLTPSVPAGAAEVRVHLTSPRATALAILLHRYWPDSSASATQMKAG